MLIHKHNEFGAVTRTVEKTGDYTVFRGRWFKAFAEPIRGDARAHLWPDCPAIWYLSDHSAAAGWGLCEPLRVLDLPGVTASEEGRVLPFDVGCARTGYDAEDAAEHAMAQLERRATLAWIAGGIPSPWPKTTAPGCYAADLQPGFAGAYVAVNARALADAARAASGPACSECGARPASRCSYCKVALCEHHGDEHQPPDCPPQMAEYLQDNAPPDDEGLSTLTVYEHGREVAVHRDVRIEPTRRRLCDCPRMPGWGTACVHVRARLAELAEGGDESEAP